MVAPSAVAARVGKTLRRPGKCSQRDRKQETGRGDSRRNELHGWPLESRSLAKEKTTIRNIQQLAAKNCEIAFFVRVSFRTSIGSRAYDVVKFSQAVAVKS